MAWRKVAQNPTWEFEKQREIEGVFVSKEENIGPNHSTLYTLELPDHSFMGVWGSTVLDVRFKNLQPGELVRVTYLGKEKSEKRKGAEYHNFDVEHDVPDEEEAVNDNEPGADPREEV